MTFNQLFLLLEIYRGTSTEAAIIDLDYLLRRKLICKAFVNQTDETIGGLMHKIIRCPEGDIWYVTEAGHKLIVDILNICSGK